MRRALAPVTAAVLILLSTPGAAAAGLLGGGGGSSQCAAFADSDEVVLRDNCFEATVLFVSPGAAVRVSNEGAVAHTYTAVDGSFDSGTLQPGESATITVGAAGAHKVYCELHASRDGFGMAGALVVGDARPVSDAAPASGDAASAASSVPQAAAGAGAPERPASGALAAVSGAGLIVATAALGLAMATRRRLRLLDSAPAR